PTDTGPSTPSVTTPRSGSATAVPRCPSSSSAGGPRKTHAQGAQARASAACTFIRLGAAPSRKWCPFLFTSASRWTINRHHFLHQLTEISCHHLEAILPKRE